MNTFSKLQTISGLSQITRNNVKNSIKRYLIKMWIKNGSSILDYSGSLTDNIINYSKVLLPKLKPSLSKDLDTMITRLNSYKTDSEGSLSYPKFLIYKMSEGYILSDIYELQFHRDFNSTVITELKEYIIETINNIYNDINTYIDNISPDDVLEGIADIIFEESYSIQYINIVNNENLIYIDTSENKNIRTKMPENKLITLADGGTNLKDFRNEIYTKALAKCYTDMCSPLSSNKNKLDEFNAFFKLINPLLETYTDKDKTKIYNRLSYLVLGMPLFFEDRYLNIKEKINKDLNYIIIDKMIYTCIIKSMNNYNNINNYISLFQNIIEKYTYDNYFSIIKNENESDAIINPLIDKSAIENVYKRYNKTFNDEPEIYNKMVNHLIKLYKNERDGLPIDEVVIFIDYDKRPKPSSMTREEISNEIAEITETTGADYLELYYYEFRNFIKKVKQTKENMIFRIHYTTLDKSDMFALSPGSIYVDYNPKLKVWLLNKFIFNYDTSSNHKYPELPMTNFYEKPENYNKPLDENEPAYVEKLIKWIEDTFDIDALLLDAESDDVTIFKYENPTTLDIFRTKYKNIIHPDYVDDWQRGNPDLTLEDEYVFKQTYYGKQHYYISEDNPAIPYQENKKDRFKMYLFEFMRVLRNHDYLNLFIDYEEEKNVLESYKSKYDKFMNTFGNPKLMKRFLDLQDYMFKKYNQMDDTIPEYDISLFGPIDIQTVGNLTMTIINLDGDSALTDNSI